VKCLAPVLCLSLLVCGCGLSMTQQRKYKTYAPSAFWADGASARPLPDGVVAEGDLATAAAERLPPDVSPALLARGRERFDIYCGPCHGLAGDADGIIVAHGFPKPPSLHNEHLLAAPAQHLYDVITRGDGVMYSYSDRIEPRDRWAIVAYIRALQLSRRAVIAQVPEARNMLR
jgi:mono/diheme cytochrome c family protein